MTDRENLRKAIDILEHELAIYGHTKTEDNYMGFYNAIQLLQDVYRNGLIVIPDPYQPTGRACFDKPAGTPIEHWETVE